MLIRCNDLSLVSLFISSQRTVSKNGMAGTVRKLFLSDGEFTNVTTLTKRECKALDYVQLS